MSVLSLNSIRAALLAAGVAFSTLSHAELDATAAARLAALRQSPESAGALVYRGETFAQDSSAAGPLFRYERRVSSMEGGLTASHLTRDAHGELVIVESAQTTTDHELQRFEVVNRQAHAGYSGYSGAVTVSEQGQHLAYLLVENGKTSTASERVAAPVVTGPSLYGFIVKRWDELMAGNAVQVRMLVLKEKTTYGFDIRLDAQTDRHTSFKLTPSSFLIRLAVAPLRVVYDSTTRNVVRYEGRVPPMVLVGDTLRDLDARVEYTPVAASVR